MKKAYTSGNYIIFDIDGNIRPYPSVETYYDEDGVNFIAINKNTKGGITIPFLEVGDWYNEAGDTAFSEATLRTFLRENTEVNFNEAGASAQKTGESNFETTQTEKEVADDDIEDGDTVLVMPNSGTVNELLFVTVVVNNSFTVNRIIINPLGSLTNNLPFTWILFRKRK